MTIGINGYEAVVPRFGYDKKTGLPNRVGSGLYCYELLKSFFKIDKENKYLIFLPCEPTSDLPKESNNWHYKIVKPRKLWTLFGLSMEFLFKKSRLDVFFSPTHYLPLSLSTPAAISILDLSYIHFSELFQKRDLLQLKLWGSYSINKAKHIFTISQASKDDIINLYKIPEKKVVITYPGIREVLNIEYRTLSMDKLKEKYNIKGDYILFVGTLQPRKNIVRLIEAFSRLKTRDLGKKTDLGLIIVGKKGWMWEEILGAPRKFGIEKRVKFLHSVPDGDLPVFYRNAICFVLPSLYEGFGLPVLEAMKYGCPVITSNVSSLPEAGGEAALYIDPLSVSDITAKIENIIKDKELRAKLIKKGLEQVRKFSWEKTARETLKVLEEIGKKHE
ncbi:MAG: glycosyltransferase family 4 protein [Patescibacteria group bacterium]|nr:glycosyltransferase family 4 protein [Patescibacteria group bacterium]